MTTMFYDSVGSAVRALEVKDGAQSFSDALKGVNLNDAQQTYSFLEPQLLRVAAGSYMIKYPLADYATHMPVDTEGTIWSAGSLYYSGDIAGKPEWFDVAGDDMPYADASRESFLQENHMAAIGYKWDRMTLERAQQLGRNPIAEKADAAAKTAERFIHRAAMVGDGAKFTTGFLNSPLMTTTSAASTLASSSPDVAATIVNNALNKVLIDTKETYMPTRLLLPTSEYLALSNRRMTDGAERSILDYIKKSNLMGEQLEIGFSRHLETAGAGGTKRMIAYANTPEVHRFYLPGGGYQTFPAWQKGIFSWEVGGLMNIGGYDLRIPNAVVAVDGI
jgi:hypothetical protein